MGGRYIGVLTHWDAAEGFGEITMAGHAPLVCHRDQLRAAGVVKPVLGMSLSFTIGVIGRGITGAADIERVAPAVRLGVVR